MIFGDGGGEVAVAGGLEDDGGGEAAVAGGLADPSLLFAKREVMDANCGLLSLVLLPLLLLRRNAPAVSDGARQNSIITAKTNRHATGTLSLFDALRQNHLGRRKSD